MVWTLIYFDSIYINFITYYPPEFAVHLDMTRVFNNVLLQQTQQQDSHGDKTVAALYQQWYTEILLRRVSTGIITFSPNQRAFVSLTAEGALPFSAEEFTDVTELRALAELIGPYGMKHMNETLMWQITSQLTELKVRRNIKSF